MEAAAKAAAKAEAKAEAAAGGGAKHAEVLKAARDADKAPKAAAKAAGGETHGLYDSHAATWAVFLQKREFEACTYKIEWWTETQGEEESPADARIREINDATLRGIKEMNED